MYFNKKNRFHTVKYMKQINIFIEKVICVTVDFMAPFYGWGSTASRLEPLQGGSLLLRQGKG